MDNNNQYEDVCMLCHRSESKAGQMIKMPGNLCVCKDCMDKTYDMVNRMGLGNLFSGMPNVPAMSREEMDEWMNSITGVSDDISNAFKEVFEGDEKPKKQDEPDSQPDTTPDAKPDETEAEPEDNPASEPDDGEEEEPKEDRRPSGARLIFEDYLKGFPGINFVNLSDLEGGMPGRNRVKRKKPGDKKPIIDIKNVPAPHKIKEQLDEYIIGQDHAKKVVSVAVYNHYKRVATGTMDNIEIEKSNMLMIGPTGCGKTYLVKTLAKLLDVPLAIADATSLTEAGYIGDDIESVISKLLAAADNDVDKAEMGIVFIDEIDKIAKKQNSNSRDVSGESVQQGLLRLLEGADVEVPVGAMSKNAMVPLTTVNTRNILFICGGAFPDLEEIIKQRMNKTTAIGYGADLRDKFDKDKDILDKVQVEDLKKFGMIPEFLGRLPVIYTLQGMTKEALVKILKEPKNAILKQYAKLLELDEVKLEFTDDALEAIADKALEKDTGARALRAIIEEFMLDIMYEIPKDDNIGRVTITREYIEGTGGPIIDIRNNAASFEEREHLNTIEEKVENSEES